MDSEMLTLIIVLIVIFITVLIVVFFLRKKIWPITMIRDLDGKPLYAIFQSANTFIVKNMKIDKFEPAKFKNWSDVVSFLDKELLSWE